METSSIKKKTKFPWRAVVIPSVVISSIAVCLLLYDFCESETLHFTSARLSGYDLSDIGGRPSDILTSEYNYASLSSTLRTHGLIFPSKSQSGSIAYFEYFERVKKYKSGIYDRYEIYLEWRMDSTEFEQELSRLKNIKSQKTIVYSENVFLLPSFVSSYNFWADYEYAIIDEENTTIRYISFSEIGKRSNIVFSLDYAPKKVLKRTDLKKVASITGTYTIYQ